MKTLNTLKGKLLNWLLKDVVVEEIRTKKLVDKGNTFYVDIADFDHNTIDGSRTESQMWYNSTDHVLRYRNDTGTVDIGGGAEYTATSTELMIHNNATARQAYTEVYVKLKEIDLGSDLTITPTNIMTEFTYGMGGPVTRYARVYKNGVAHGTERSTSAGGSATHQESLSFDEDDLYQVYGKTNDDADYVLIEKQRVFGVIALGFTDQDP
jgi:hypothetical protein